MNNETSLRESSKEVAKESWGEIKTKIKTQWSKILDEDLDALRDDKDLLIAKIQQVYGHAKERAEKEYEAFMKLIKTKKDDEVEDDIL